jgi:hypothetical protein
MTTSHSFVCTASVVSYLMGVNIMAKKNLISKNAISKEIAKKISAGKMSEKGIAALELFGEGYELIPIVPGEKRPPFKWDPWLDGLSPETIAAHYASNPSHDVAVIPGDSLIVFDADTPEAVIALYQLADAHDLVCNRIVSTKRGEHQYFKRADDTHAKSCAPDKLVNPAGIDIKTGRALAVAPPSTNKSYLVDEAESIDDLIEVDQNFIDAVYRHNGMQPPGAAPVNIRTVESSADQNEVIRELESLLEHIDPDCGYETWLKALMAVHNATGGSDDGFRLADDWSGPGATYPGKPQMRVKWRSFDNAPDVPITIATLYQLVKATGVDPGIADYVADPEWDLSGGDTLVQPANPKESICIDSTELNRDDSSERHPLAAYSLRGMSAQLEAESNKAR